MPRAGPNWRRRKNYFLNAYAGNVKHKNEDLRLEITAGARRKPGQGGPGYIVDVQRQLEGERPPLNT